MTGLVLYIVQMCIISGLLALAMSVYLDGLGYVVLHIAALAGVGAYGFAITTTRLGWSPIPGALFALCISLTAGVAAAALIGSLRSDGLTLATFGLGVAAFELFRFSGITGGVFGMGAIPGLEIPDTQMSQALGAISFALAGLLLVWRWRRSIGGRVVTALRMDEWAGVSIGAPLRGHQLMSGALAGVLAGAAGIYMAAITHFIEPSDFRVVILLVPLAAVMVGGGRTPLRVAAVASAIVIVSQGARFVGNNPVTAGPITEIAVAVLVGVALVTVRLRQCHSGQVDDG